MDEETVKTEYPFLLGQPLAVPQGPVEFLSDNDIGKNIFVIAYNATTYIKFRGTVERYDSTSRSIVLNPCRSLNADGTDLDVLPGLTSFSEPGRLFGYEFPTQIFGLGYQFRASRTSVSSLYNLAFRSIVARSPSFYEDPVVGGKSKKSKRKSKKKIKQ